jgi:hypothetical protein
MIPPKSLLVRRFRIGDVGAADVCGSSADVSGEAGPHRKSQQLVNA